MIKNINKDKKGLFINPKFLFVIAVIVVIYFGFFYTASFFDVSRVQSTNIKLISEDNDKAVYEFNFNYEPNSKSSDCNVQENIAWDIEVIPIQSTSSLPSFSQGLIENKEVETSNVEISGISATYNVCSDKERGTNIVFTDNKAICKIKNLQDNKAYVTCKFKGSAYATYLDQKVASHYYGLSSGKAIITFPKENSQITISNNLTDNLEINNDNNNSYSSTTFINKVALWIQNLIDKILGVFNK